MYCRWTNFTLASQLFHLEGIQKTGLEGLWLDASWFKQAHGFGRSGDWHIPLQSLENRSAFPGGLGVLGQAAHEPPHDTAFIVWVSVAMHSADLLRSLMWLLFLTV